MALGLMMRVARLLAARIAIGLLVIGPPLHHEPALLQVLGLVDIGGPHRVPLLVAHLPFNGIARPQARLNQ